MNIIIIEKKRREEKAQFINYLWLFIQHTIIREMVTFLSLSELNLINDFSLMLVCLIIKLLPKKKTKEIDNIFHY